jgi:hypothetical protein
MQVLREIGAASDLSKRYFEFTVHLWNLCRFLPDRGVAAKGAYYPSEVPRNAVIDNEQLNMRRFTEKLTWEGGVLAGAIWALNRILDR